MLDAIAFPYISGSDEYLWREPTANIEHVLNIDLIYLLHSNIWNPEVKATTNQ